MTPEEAKYAVEHGSIIQFVGEPQKWGVLTYFDGELTVYYKPKGMGLFRPSTTIEHIEFPKGCKCLPIER